MKLSAFKYLPALTLSFAALLLPVDAGRAATLTSANFSLGYGFTGASAPVGTWNTSETSSVNTPTTQGNFVFSPSIPNVGGFSSSGPKFDNRVLSNGTLSGDSSNFGMTIIGTWIGTTPVDAAPIPNYQISIVITQVSIYGLAYSSLSGVDLAWHESTVGHTSSSSSITLNQVSTVPAFGNASNYLQLAWNPNDYSVSGTTTTRSFDLTASNARVIDGLQVFGYVQLTYDAIPEPGTLGLMGFAAGSFLLLRRRRKSHA